MKQIPLMIAAKGCSKDTPKTSKAGKAEAQVTAAPSPDSVPSAN